MNAGFIDGLTTSATYWPGWHLMALELLSPVLISQDICATRLGHLTCEASGGT